jgi:long-chain acyl-CoA synthetase
VLPIADPIDVGPRRSSVDQGGQLEWNNHPVPYVSLERFATDERVIAEVQTAVDATNRQVSRVEQLKRFAILPTEWGVESDELTPTLKLKRRVIHHKYAKDIERLYA